MKPKFDMLDPDQAFQIVRLAQIVVETHDDLGWDEKTIETDFGDALDYLRNALGMDLPDEREGLLEGIRERDERHEARKRGHE